MSARANYFKIGLFILVAVALGVAFLVVLGLGASKSDAVPMETYFDESIQGLDVGSPVKFRGVKIGEVTKIDFTQREYGGTSALRYVLVRMAIQPGILEAGRKGDSQEAIAKEIAAGLRIQLKQQGITGLAYIGLDYMTPEDYKPMPIAWTPNTQYIPSAPSTFTQLGDHLENIGRSLDRIQDFDFRKLLDQVDTLVANVGLMVDQFKMDELQTEAVGLMIELRETNQDLRRLLAKDEIEVLLRDGGAAATGARRIIENDLPTSLGQMDKTLKRVGMLINTQQDQFSLILKNLSTITDNLEDITNRAQQFPGQILFGTPESPMPEKEKKE